MEEDPFPLHTAASAGNIEEIHSLIEQGADINTPKFYGVVGFTPLHFAVFYNHENVVQELLNRGSDTTLHFPILVLAAYKGNVNIVHRLLTANAHVNALYDTGLTFLTPLYAAALSGNIETIQQLLASNADGSIGFPSALYAAVLADKYDKIYPHILSEAETPPAVFSDEVLGFMTKLALSPFVPNEIFEHTGEIVTNGEQTNNINTEAIIQTLIDAHVPIDADLPANAPDQVVGIVPTLCLAAAIGSEATVQKLLSENASVDPDRNKKPLAYAAQSGRCTIVEQLLRAGAPVDAGKPRALTIAVILKHNDVVKRLLAAGASPGDDIPIRRTRVLSPLHIAAAQNQEETVQLLINAGADTQKKVTYSPFVKCIRKLLRKPTEYTVSDFAQTNDLKNYIASGPLTQQLFPLALQGRIYKIAALFRNGADRDVADRQGNTLAHLAAKKNDSNLARVLILHGTDFTKINLEDQTPLDINPDVAIWFCNNLGPQEKTGETL